MDLLGTFADARRKILADVQQFLTKVQNLSAAPLTSVEAGIGMLNRLRQEAYEDLNQIQHEHMILCAAEWLVKKARFPTETVWSWNPRQGGSKREPDLRGKHRRVVIVSAEITTSKNPNGVIDTRMRDTLRKLSTMEAQKFYFARTQSMCRRARTKIRKAGWPINVVQIVPKNTSR